MPKELTKEEGYAAILRGLISYHRRLSMRNVINEDGTDVCSKSTSACPVVASDDIYLDALTFALACVEEKISTAAHSVEKLI